MSTCSWVRPRLVAFLLGELSPRTADKIASHLGLCPACLRELDSLQHAVSHLEQVAQQQRSPLPSEPPTAVADGAVFPVDRQLVRELVRGAKRRRPSTWAMAAGTAAALAVVVWWTIGPLLGPPPVVGEILRVSGHPQMRVRSRGEFEAVRAGERVTAGSQLRTSETDTLEVQLRDGSRVRLDFDTTLELAEDRDRRGAAHRIDLHLRAGRIWLLVTPAQTGLRVYTPAGTAEALGTIFEVAITDAGSREEDRKGPKAEPGGRTTVTVLRGEVRLANRHGEVTAPAGTRAEALASAPPRPPERVRYLATLQVQNPWGVTIFEAWVLPPLTPAEAADRLTGERGWLGVEVGRTPDAARDAAAPAPGVPIRSVASGSPAQQAQLLPGDRLVRIEETAIQEPADLQRVELLFSPGQRVRVVTEHAGVEQEHQITLASHPGKAWRDSRLAEANRELMAGRLMQAQSRYQELTSTPHEADAFNNLGVLAELQGQTEQAESWYRRAVNRDPAAPRYHFNLAMALYRIGNLRSAAREFEVVLARDRDFPEAGFLLGRIHSFLGEFEDAMEQALRLQSVPATRAQGLCLSGEIARLKGDLSGAESWYLKAAQADPGYEDPPTYLGATYYLEGKLDQAMLWTERALALVPDSVRALNRLGLILYHQGRLTEAERALRTAEAKHPGYLQVYNNLGLIYFEQNRLAEAKTAYRKGIALAPDQVLCHIGLAMALERNREFAAAKQEYRTVLRLAPTYEDAYQRLAALHRQLGETQSAQAVLTIAHRYGL